MAECKSILIGVGFEPTPLRTGALDHPAIRVCFGAKRREASRGCKSCDCFFTGAHQLQQHVDVQSNKRVVVRLTLGRHSADVLGANKRDACKLAAQQLLARVHPGDASLRTWGVLVAYYVRAAQRQQHEEHFRRRVVDMVQAQLANDDAKNLIKPNQVMLDVLCRLMHKFHVKRKGNEADMPPPMVIDLQLCVIGAR